MSFIEIYILRLWGCYFESEELDTGVAATQLFKILSGSLIYLF